jgi:hypothetical protein
MISLDQTQTVAYPRFTMPIDIVADGTPYVIFNDADVEHFVIPVPAAPTTVAFDPDAWVLWSTVTQQAYVPGPPKIVETSPAPGEVALVQDGIDTVTIYFQTPVNLSPAHISLVGDNAGPQSFTLASGSGANPVVLNLSDPLPQDTYELTVSAAVVSAAGGLALDGEIADADDPMSLPSGNGAPGGAAIIRFTVGSSIPAASTWGLIILVMLISTAGTLVLRRHPYSSMAACRLGRGS